MAKKEIVKIKSTALLHLLTVMGQTLQHLCFTCFKHFFKHLADVSCILIYYSVLKPIFFIEVFKANL